MPPMQPPPITHKFRDCRSDVVRPLGHLHVQRLSQSKLQGFSSAYVYKKILFCVSQLEPGKTLFCLMKHTCVTNCPQTQQGVEQDSFINSVVL